MRIRYIDSVKPLEDYILQVDFITGSRLLLNMKPYLDSLRFRPLCRPGVWQSAHTNGVFVWFDDVEMRHDEIMIMAAQSKIT